MTEAEQKAIFGKNISRYARSSFDTERKFAAAFGVPRSTASAWLRGEVLPHLMVLRRLAEFFNVEVADLIEDPARSADAGTDLLAQEKRLRLLDTASRIADQDAAQATAILETFLRKN